MGVEQKAREIVRARQHAYASPSINFRRIALMWEAILGVPITPQQVALMLLALKISREVHRHSEDNLIDMVGYVICLEDIILNEVQREQSG